MFSTKAGKLRKAAAAGDTAKCKQLVAAKASVNVSGFSSGSNAFHKAICGGHLDTATFLQTAGAELEARNAGGKTALNLAAESGNLATVDFLLALGVDTSTPCKKGGRPLYYAALQGEKDICAALLNAKALVDAPGMLGRSPLYASIYGGSSKGGETARFLHSVGASVNAENANGVGPLNVCLQPTDGVLVDEDIAIFLVEQGADPNRFPSASRYSPLFVLRGVISARFPFCCSLC